MRQADRQHENDAGRRASGGDGVRVEVNESSAKYLAATTYNRTELGILPADWRIAKVADVAEASSGTTPPRAQYERFYQRGVHAWVKTLDLNNAEIRLTDESVTDSALQEANLRLFPVGSVLVAMYGGLRQIGRTGLLRIPAAVNQAITAIRPRPDCLCSEFLLFYLNHRVGYWQSVASSSRKDPNITGADVRAFKLPLPTIDDQRRIAKALIDADALIDSLEQLLTKKRQIKQGAMQELLTGKRRLPGFSGEWRSSPLGDLAKIKTGSMNNQDKVVDGAYPFFVRSQTVEQIDTFTHDCEAILIPGEGGIGSIFHYVNGRFALHQRVYGITDFSAEVLGRFLFFYVRVFFGAHAMQNSVKATVDSLRLPTFLDFEVRVPPTMDEQAAIVDALSDLEGEAEALESRLTKARALKQAMAQALLTGRIRLVEPAA